VERLDFSYGVIDSSGNTKFLSASQVDSATDCPPDVSVPGGLDESGCLWRAVQTVEAHVLMDGQTPLYTLTPAEMYYVYSPDGGTVPTAPSTHAVQPDVDQGFPKQLIRREFTTLVALRNFNP
jgi:type IV pilus assembly protein PilW